MPRGLSINMYILMDAYTATGMVQPASIQRLHCRNDATNTIICQYFKCVNPSASNGSAIGHPPVQLLNIIQAYRKNVTEIFENNENKQIRKIKKKKIVKSLHINIHFSIIIWYNQTTQYSVLF